MRAFALLLGFVSATAFAAVEPVRSWDVQAEQAQAMAVDAAGGIYTVVRSYNPSPAPLTIEPCMTVVKRSGDDGHLVWSQKRCATYTVSSNEPRRSETPTVSQVIAIDPAGNPIVLASVAFTRWLARLDAATGNPLWESSAPTPAATSYTTLGMALGPGGDVWMRTVEDGGSRMTRVANATGAVVWSTVLSPTADGNNESLVGVAPTGESVTSMINGGQRMVGLSADGEQRWNYLLSTQAEAMVTDNQGYFYLRTVDTNGTSSQGFPKQVEKRLIDTGTIQWLVTGNTFTHNVDAQGNLYRTVREDGDSTALYKFYVEKYSPSGTRLWRRRPAPMGTAELVPIAFAFDAGGDVYAWVGGGVVSKIEADTGTEMWQFNGAPVTPQATGLLGIAASREGVVLHYFAGSNTTRLALHKERTLPATGLARARDFDGDGYADIAFSSGDGSSALWLMMGGQQVGGARMTGPGGWRAQRLADFDGDGHVDVFFGNTDGSAAIWLMNGTTQVGGARLLAPGTGWSLAFLADFNGDGKADILWKHTDGSYALWLMNGAQQAGGARLLGAGSGWTAKLVADFNGDRMADILWQHSDGSTAMWLMNGAQQMGGARLLGAGSTWVAEAAGDFNGDGRADIAWFNNGDGSNAMWLMDGTQQVGGARLRPGATNWHAVGSGDFDGDGKDDLVFRHASGPINIDFMSGTTALRSQALSNANDVVAGVADLNGDGRPDIVTQSTLGAVRAWERFTEEGYYTSELLPLSTPWSLVPMPSGGLP